MHECIFVLNVLFTNFIVFLILIFTYLIMIHTLQYNLISLLLQLLLLPPLLPLLLLLLLPPVLILFLHLPLLLLHHLPLLLLLFYFISSFSSYSSSLGGRGVIDGIEKNLQLTPRHVEASRHTLYTYGTYRSSTRTYSCVHVYL